MQHDEFFSCLAGTEKRDMVDAKWWLSPGHEYHKPPFGLTCPQCPYTCPFCQYPRCTLKSESEWESGQTKTAHVHTWVYEMGGQSMLRWLSAIRAKRLVSSKTLWVFVFVFSLRRLEGRKWGAREREFLQRHWLTQLWRLRRPITRHLQGETQDSQWYHLVWIPRSEDRVGGGGWEHKSPSKAEETKVTALTGRKAEKG